MQKLPEDRGRRRFVVAFSGGIDSTVLLHALHRMQEFDGLNLFAVHVNHGLSRNAGAWAAHCRAFCEARRIAFEMMEIDARGGGSQGPEARARALRYRALGRCVGQDDVLLTAHHRDDQAETVLLRLLRGAGAEGLAGMPAIRPFGAGWLARPLLAVTRNDIADYARRENLSWVEDESNVDTGLDRNFIRCRVMPVIAGRWPSAGATLARAAEHQADLAALLDDMAALDLAAAQDPAGGALMVPAVNRLSLPRKRNLLRYWLKTTRASIPGARIVENIIDQLFEARADSLPCVRFGGTEVRRYRDRVYAMTPLEEGDHGARYVWRLPEPLELKVGRLVARPVKGAGLRADAVAGDKVDVRFRTGGERIRPAGRKHTRELKKLFQEAGIPPWRRDRIPLLYLDDTLAAVAGLWVDEQFSAGKEEDGWEISLAVNDG